MTVMTLQDIEIDMGTNKLRVSSPGWHLINIKLDSYKNLELIKDGAKMNNDRGE